MKVKVAAGLAKAETLGDRSIKLTFNTRELGEDAIHLFGMVHSEGWLVYAENEDANEADIPAEKADPMLSNKTQAQRLRGSLYRLWEQKGKQGDFEDYYKSRLEQFIDKVKEQLE